MNKIETDLLIADSGMRRTAALRFGRDMARKSGARLHLCIIDHDPLIERTADLVHPKVMHLARSQFEQERNEWLAHEAETLSQDGVDVTCEMIWAPRRYDGLIAKCLEISPDLVIADSSQKDDRQLMRYCPAPLLLVPKDSAAVPKRIIVAVDTALEIENVASMNRHIVMMALRAAYACDAELHLAHAFPFTRNSIIGRMHLHSDYNSLRTADERAFDRFADTQNVPVERRHKLTGTPESRLPILAKRISADLMVLGFSYRSGLDRFVLGSTAEKLASAQPCKLLFIKSEDFTLELGKNLDLDAIRRRHADKSSTSAHLLRNARLI
ncbi:MAG: universal stress protein [Pseudomonadota bacterium]|nr:universal stress protein [Pseudomonadota bacterium]